MPFEKIMSLYRVSKAELYDKGGLLPVTVHRSDPRLFGMIELLLLLGWILGLQLDCNSSGPSREDDIYMFLWHVRF